MERTHHGRPPRGGWRRPALSATSLRWWAGGFAALVGAFMLVVPGQFEAQVYARLTGQVPLFGLVLLTCGWALLVVAALRPRRSWHLAVHALVVVAFMLFAGSFAASGAWTATALYALLAAALVVSALLPVQQVAPPGVRRGDLLALAFGVAQALGGALLLVLPAVWLGVYAPLDETRLGLAGLMLASGLLLAAVQLRPDVPRAWSQAAHVGAGAVLLATALVKALPMNAWGGVVLYLSSGALVTLLPWLHQRLRHFDPASLATRLALLLAATSSLPLVLTIGLLQSAGLSGTGEARLSAFAAILGVVALAVAFGIGAARLLAHPLRRLGEAADRLAAGEPAVPLGRSGITEVDRLSANFGHMRDRLLERTQRAEELAGELRRRADELAESDRRKDEFVAMLAHELRNPLGAVSSAAYLIEESGEDDGETTALAAAVVRRQMRHLSRLVDDLLDVSRITRGKVSLQRAAVDLVDVLRRSVEMALPQFEAKGMTLDVELPAVSLPLHADATRLEQVFGNLLGNAAKYTGEGGRASLSAVHDGNGSALVRVCDEGIGIRREDLPRVFDLFYQGSPSLDRHDGGLGLGLTLVRRLVELHGGEVTVSSEGTGQGSEFVVRLPLADRPS